MAASPASGGRLSVPGVQEPRGHDSLLDRLMPSTVCRDYEGEVKEVKARIEELLDEIDPETEVQAEGVDVESPPSRRGSAQRGSLQKGVAVARRGSTRRSLGSQPSSEFFEEDIEEVAQDVSESDSDTYLRMDPDASSQAARAKLSMLLARLNTEEREGVLKDVGIWLHGKVDIARRELTTLGRLDRECELRGFERETAVRSVVDGLRSHETDIAGAVSHFCRELETVHRQVQGRDEFSKREDAEGVGAMGVEELEELIEAVKAQLKTREAETWTLLRELEGAEIGVTLEADEGQQPGEGRGDLVQELEKMAVYQRESLRETEKRAANVKSALDHLVGQTSHGADFDDFVQISPAAEAILEEVREEMSKSLLPGLLEEREREYGDKLRPPDESYLDAVRRECEILHERIDSTQAVMEALRADDDSVEADLRAQLQIVEEEGVLPKNSALHRCFDALDATDWDELVHDKEHKFQHLVALESEVRKSVQSHLGQANRTQQSILEIYRMDRTLATRVELMEHRANIYRGTLEVLEDHRAMYAAAAKLIKSQESAAERVDRKAEKALAGQSALAVAAVSALASMAPVARGWAQEEWAKPFQPDEDDSYGAEAVSQQAEVLAGLRAEEKRLKLECQQLEDTLEQRTYQLVELSNLGIGGMDGELPEQLKESLGSSHDAVESFAKSLQKLAEVAQAEATSTSEKLSDRHLAIERVRHERQAREAVDAFAPSSSSEATAEGLSVGGLEGMDKVLHDTVAGQAANQKLAGKILALQPEVDMLKKKHLLLRKAQRDKTENAEQYRTLRQSARELSAMWAEIKASRLHSDRDIVEQSSRSRGSSRIQTKERVSFREGSRGSWMEPTGFDRSLSPGT